MNIGTDLQIPINTFLNKTTAILGSTGSGKTNTVAVLIEEILPHVPLTIVDPEGEYWGLKEQLEILVVGKSPHVDIEAEASQAEIIAEFSYKNSVLETLNRQFPDINTMDIMNRFFRKQQDIA